jgi:hypothetical protein
MWRHCQWCEVLQTQVFCNPCTGLQRPLEFPGGWGSQISRQLAHEVDQVVSPMHQPPLPQGDIYFCYRLSLLQGQMWLEGLCQWKLPMVPSEIKPMSFQLEAQCLNRLCHPQPPQTHITKFTFVNTHYGMYICQTQKFSTRSELHSITHRTYNKSLQKCPYIKQFLSAT